MSNIAIRQPRANGARDEFHLAAAGQNLRKVVPDGPQTRSA